MMSWQTVTDDLLVCRWPEAGQRIQYNPLWMRETANNVYVENVSAPVLDFTRLSPFGKVWFQAGAPTPQTN
jgi:hypothetical protein